MKTHQLIALYSLLLACAISAYFWQIIGLFWAWALLTSGLWQVSALGLYFEKKWAAPFTFALFGLALAIMLAFGVVLLVKGTDLTTRGSLVFLITCIALFVPMRLLSSREVKEAFGLRIDDPEPESRTIEKEQA